MLGNFVGFNNSGARFGSELESGVDPTSFSAMENSAKRLVKAGSILKPKVNPNRVLKTAQFASRMESQNDLLKQHSEQLLKLANAGVERLSIGANHASGMMNVEKRYQQVMSGHTDKVLQFRMATGLIQAESRGTQQAYSTSALDAL